MTEATHAEHLAAHNNFRRFLREDWYMRYQTTPRWRRRIIDWLMK